MKNYKINITASGTMGEIQEAVADLLDQVSYGNLEEVLRTRYFSNSKGDCIFDKQKLYRVKLINGHSAAKHQNIEGYLGDKDFGAKAFGYQMIYTRGEAIKKARRFNGKIEEIK